MKKEVSGFTAETFFDERKAKMHDPAERKRPTFSPLSALILPIRSSPTYLICGDQTYNRWGDAAAITDPNGNTTYHEYDAAGRKTKVVFPDDTPGLADNPVRRFCNPSLNPTPSVNQNAPPFRHSK